MADRSRQRPHDDIGDYGNMYTDGFNAAALPDFGSTDPRHLNDITPNERLLSASNATSMDAPSNRPPPSLQSYKPSHYGTMTWGGMPSPTPATQVYKSSNPPLFPTYGPPNPQYHNDITSEGALSSSGIGSSTPTSSILYSYSSRPLSRASVTPSPSAHSRPYYSRHHRGSTLEVPYHPPMATDRLTAASEQRAYFHAHPHNQHPDWICPWGTHCEARFVPRPNGAFVALFVPGRRSRHPSPDGNPIPNEYRQDFDEEIALTPACAALVKSPDRETRRKRSRELLARFVWSLKPLWREVETTAKRTNREVESGDMEPSSSETAPVPCTRPGQAWTRLTPEKNSALAADGSTAPVDPLQPVIVNGSGDERFEPAESFGELLEDHARSRKNQLGM